ncbi:MAG: hypothetical protein ACYC5W_13800 [Thauera sp.]
MQYSRCHIPAVPPRPALAAPPILAASMNFTATLSAWFRPAPPPAPRVRAGLRRVTELAGVALAGERDFERRLSAPVAHALDYCDALVAALPNAIEVGRAAFAADPLVHALFASADDIGDMIGLSAPLREYMASPPASQGDEVFALLGARRQHKRVLGVACTGSVVSTQVPQDLLYFSSHLLTEPAPDAESAAARLRSAAFDSLLRTFAAHVESVRANGKTLKLDREMEKVRLLTRRKGPGTNAGDGDTAAFVRRIEELDVRLREHADALQPGNLLRALADLLMQPEGALSQQQVCVRVSRNGVLAPADAVGAPDATPIRFTELSTRDNRRHVVLPVRLRRDEVREALARMRAERDRMMMI